MTPQPRHVSMILTISVLAGCAAVGAGPSTPPSVTPAPVPTQETPTPEGMAPGLTASNVWAGVLSEAHAAVLNGTAFTRVEQLTVRYQDGTLRTKVVRTVQYDPASQRGYVAVDITGEATAYESGATTWEVFLGDQSFTAIGYGNDTTPDVIRRVTARTSPPTMGYDRFFDRVAAGGDVKFVFSLVEGGEITAAPAVDVVAYVVEATNESTPSESADQSSGNTSAAAARSSIRDVDLKAIVTRDGLVRRYRVTYQTHIGDTPIWVTREVRYEAIGTTTVDRPEWYEQAVNQTARSAADSSPRQLLHRPAFS